MNGAAYAPHSTPRSWPDRNVVLDPESEHVPTSSATKQLVVWASDLVLEPLALDSEAAAPIAAGLIERRVLPACYRRRYDESFLERFHNIIEQTRNFLVSDLPFLSCTASELAAHAIFAGARTILRTEIVDLDAPGRLVESNPALPTELVANLKQLSDETDALFAATVEDADVCALFELPPEEDPSEHLSIRVGMTGLSLLHFENWFAPFGAPRPYIAGDGRAWPAQV